MELFRVYAYSVFPQRLSEADERMEPEGGPVRLAPELKSVMEENYSDANFGYRPSIDFVFKDGDRTNPIRDAVMGFAFGDSRTPGASASKLATALSEAMDGRSPACLFVPVAFRDEDKRRVVLWIFPKEDAFQLRRGVEETIINVLRDVFSHKSPLKKAASFEGRNNRAGFMQGRVLDYQAGTSYKDAADFWVGKFLCCQQSISDDAGTRLLANAVRKTYTNLSLEEREKLFVAVMAMRHAPNKRITLSKFADRYLQGETKTEFLKHAPNDVTRSTVFNFKTDAFDDKVKFRVFQLETGVLVSTPFDEIGKSVFVEGQDDERSLQCGGRIDDDKLRS